MLILTNLFIILYLVIAWTWHLPKDSHAKRLVDKASPVVMWLGLWHSWKMFAPQPSLVNRRLIIELVHANRKKVVIADTNLESLSRWSSFLNCRERKYHSNLAGPDYKSHQDALCRYAASHFSNSNSPVVRVNLFLAKQRIANPCVFEEKAFTRTLLHKCILVES